MKTILVDVINGLINPDGTTFQEMHGLLETYPNPKLVLTGANDEQWKKFNLDSSLHEVFALKHNPEKTDPKYFKNDEKAKQTAESVGINSYFYDHTKQDLEALKILIYRS